MQVCNPMEHDLISTATVAGMLGKTVATVNRWAAEGKITPALKMPGDTGARLYRRTDIEALRPRPSDVIGFLVSVAVCFLMIGILIWLAGIGATGQ